jgi:hypothetical protein
MLGSVTVLTLRLYQVQTNGHVADELFGKRFAKSSLLLNAIQAQIELMTNTIFDEQARWELRILPKEEFYFISISPSTVLIQDLRPWHAAGLQASINVFDAFYEAIDGKRDLVDSMKIHIKDKSSSQVA